MSWVLIVWLCSFGRCSPVAIPDHLSEELCYMFKKELSQKYMDSERIINESGVCISKFDGKVIGE